MQDDYSFFLTRIRELADLKHAESLMGWDQETYMPPNGINMRARAQGSLSGLIHERLTETKFVRTVERLKDLELKGDEAVNISRVARQLKRSVGIPRQLVIEMSETTSLGHEAWISARNESDFAVFRPWLEKIIDQKRQFADLIGYEGSIYNALVDEYEPGATIESIMPLFEQLRLELVPLVDAISEKGIRPAAGILDRVFDVSKQELLGRQIISDMGFDMKSGRLDVAIHPFCSGTSPDDVRLTTRYDKRWLPGSLFGSMHEAGHGLYEQGLPSDVKGDPVGQSISLGIHESQSRMWENMVGRSLAFWNYYFPQLQTIFPGVADDMDLDRFYRAINQVVPSFIRVEADEVTYNLHIIVRLELEVALFEQQLVVKDLPEAWNEKMDKYLGIVPKDDKYGVLQDVHWSLGHFGYFPTYTLGNLYSAQFFKQLCEDITDVFDQISQGQLIDVKKWLNENIHSYGSRLTADELVQQVTGRPLGVEDFTNYLKKKFNSLYNLSN
ncbi:MAG: carboxypeptidase M32 [Candidatus Latescibacterota bacterium]|nr:carboxypeptidase M32 [Candidatus Latescibacterota bacterium]